MQGTIVLPATTANSAPAAAPGNPTSDVSGVDTGFSDLLGALTAPGMGAAPGKVAASPPPNATTTTPPTTPDSAVNDAPPASDAPPTKTADPTLTGLARWWRARGRDGAGSPASAPVLSGPVPVIIAPLTSPLSAPASVARQPAAGSAGGTVAATSAPTPGPPIQVNAAAPAAGAPPLALTGSSSVPFDGASSAPTAGAAPALSDGTSAAPSDRAPSATSDGTMRVASPRPADRAASALTSVTAASLPVAPALDHLANGATSSEPDAIVSLVTVPPSGSARPGLSAAGTANGNATPSAGAPVSSNSGVSLTGDLKAISGVEAASPGAVAGGQGFGRTTEGVAGWLTGSEPRRKATPAAVPAPGGGATPGNAPLAGGQAVHPGPDPSANVPASVAGAAQQIAAQAALVHHGQQAEMRLRLRPPDLGEVRVVVRRDASGALSAHLIPATREAATALAPHLEHLRAALAAHSQGQGASVSLGGQGADQGRQPDAHRGRDTPASDTPRPATTATPARPAIRAVRSGATVDYDA